MDSITRCYVSHVVPPTLTGRPGRKDLLWKTAILAGVACAVAASFAFGPAPEVATASLGAARVLGLLAAAYALATIVLGLRYRPVPAPRDAELPTVTVVVPAFNEGETVRLALGSALASDYPRDKLHVVVIDDGSTDDTWAHIEEIARRHEGRVTAIRAPRNGGKREALRQGFLLARGEVVVTVDSDSCLERGALRAAVAPLVRDARVAVVGGKVLVLNRWQSLVTRLLAARFCITFDFLRAAQSRFGAVLCCPGALSAYRRSAVLDVLEAWSTQRFLGSPCTIGEDRALTTWLLRRGHRAVYQSTALVRTIVPTTLRGAARMLLRWERGNVRESLVLLPAMLGPWRTGDRLWPLLDVVMDLATWPLAFLGLATTGRALLAHPTGLVHVAASLGTGALLQSLLCLRSERNTDFVYNVAFAFAAAVGLPWIFTYSCLTLRDGRWLTR